MIDGFTIHGAVSLHAFETVKNCQVDVQVLHNTEKIIIQHLVSRFARMHAKFIHKQNGAHDHILCRKGNANL